MATVKNRPRSERVKDIDDGIHRCDVFVDRDFLDRNGVRVCVLGNISLLPVDIQQLMAEGAEMTKHNDRLLYHSLTSRY